MRSLFSCWRSSLGHGWFQRSQSEAWYFAFNGKMQRPSVFPHPKLQKIMTRHILQLEHISTGQLLLWGSTGEHTGRESTADSSQRWNQSYLYKLSFLCCHFQPWPCFLSHGSLWADWICHLLRPLLSQRITGWPPSAILGDVQSCVTDHTSAHFIVWRTLFGACASNIQPINTCLYLTPVFCSSFVP